MLSAIFKYFRRRLANAQLKPRLLALVAFIVFAYLGVNDTLDLARTIANPATMATQLGIGVSESTTRAVILISLSVVIVIASFATALGAWQRTTLLRAWPVVAVAYVLYGMAQIAIGLVLLQKPLVALTGVVYLLLAAAAYSFGRQASKALDPQAR
jgi:hypothetical protein